MTVKSDWRLPRHGWRCTTAETAESSSGAAELAEKRRFNRPTAYKAPTFSTISTAIPGDPVIPDAKNFMKGKVGLAMRYYTLLYRYL
jgi:hypothetical protein